MPLLVAHESDKLCGMALPPGLLATAAGDVLLSQVKSAVSLFFVSRVGYAPPASLGQEHAGGNAYLGDDDEQHGERSEKS
jgi:hypothetical protein